MEVPGKFGQYTLLRRLAVGGMAEIYLAKVAGLAGFEKHLVLKVIHPKFAQDPEFIQMLVHEAKLAVRLTHTNIAQVFDLGAHDGRYYIAMEYVEGLDLYQVLRRLRDSRRYMPFEVAAFIVSEICSGLEYAHQRKDERGHPLGIIHRDISPQNVLVSYEGDVKIIDFGIAKARARSQNTGVGIIKGKFFYMAPEQARGQDLDHRTDLFAVGCILYELLTNRMVYDTESLGDALRLAKQGSFLPPSSHRDGIPQELETATMRALARDREVRYQSGGQMRHDLTAWLRRASPGFGRHRLEAHIREILGRSGPGARLAPLARQEYKPEHSIVHRDDPAVADEDEGRTREVHKRPTAPLSKPEATGPSPSTRPTHPSSALERRIQEAREALSWSGPHGAVAAPPAERRQDPTTDVYAASPAPDTGAGPLPADAAALRPSEVEWADPDADPTTPESARRESDPTRPIATPPPKARAIEADEREAAEPSVEEDATVIDPGPLRRAIEEAEEAMDWDEPTPSGPQGGDDSGEMVLEPDPSTAPTIVRVGPRRPSKPLRRPDPTPLRASAPAATPATPAAARPAPVATPAMPVRAPLPPSTPAPAAVMPAALRDVKTPAFAPDLPMPEADWSATPSSDSQEDISDESWPPPSSLPELPEPSRPPRRDRLRLVLVLGGLLLAGMLAGVLVGTLSRGGSDSQAGSLFVTSRPRLGAEIYLDGQPTGRSTPSVFEALPANSVHEVRGRLAGFNEAIASNVSVEAGGQREVVLELVPLRYAATLESEPAGAEILVNGRVVAQTPATLDNLAREGYPTANVVLRLPGYADAPITLQWERADVHVVRHEVLTRLP